MIIQRFVCVKASLNKKIVAILIALLVVSSYGVLNAAGVTTRGAVSITFDDGWKNNYTNAFSVIKKYNIPVYIFLVSDFINSKYFLSWDQIFEMKKSGLIFFGNHTKNHLSLTTLGDDEIKSQILDANKEFETKLGNVEYFSYPNGHFDNRVVKIIKDAGFKYGFTIIEGINDRDSNPFLLKKFLLFVVIFVFSECTNII